MKAGLEKEKAALLVVLAVLSDGRKVVLAVTAGHRESTASWSAVLLDLAQRGLRPPQLVIGDGHLGLWAALRHVHPEAEEQRSWNHKIFNVLDKLPKRQQAAAKKLVGKIPCAETRRKAEQQREQFVYWCRQRGYPEAARCPETDWERMVTFYEGGVATPAHDQSGEVPICGRSAPHGCRQAVQESAECHRGDLEDGVRSRARVPPAETSGIAAGGVSGRLVQGRRTGQYKRWPPNSFSAPLGKTSLDRVRLLSQRRQRCLI